LWWVKSLSIEIPVEPNIFILSRCQGFGLAWTSLKKREGPDFENAQEPVSNAYPIKSGFLILNYFGKR